MKRATFLISALALAPVLTGQQYEAFEITTGTAYDVTNSGWVAGKEHDYWPYLWKESDGSIFYLQPLTPHLVYTFGTHVNEHGLATWGGVIRYNAKRNECWVYESSSGVLQRLHGGVPGDIFSRGVGNNGEIIGSINRLPQETSTAAYWLDWTEPATLVPAAEAFYGINDKGEFVGKMAGPTPMKVRACLYRLSNHELIELPFSGPYGSFASAINNHGLIVGHSGSHAAVWTEDPPNSGSFQVQNLQHPTALNSYGHDINDHGVIVGQMSLPGNELHAVISYPGYAADENMLSVNSLLINGADFEFESALSINERGWISGTGRVHRPPWGWDKYQSIVAKPLLSLMPPIPGIAGAQNDLLIFGAEPGATIHLAYSLNGNGTTDLSPWCPGLALDMANAQWAASGSADANGALHLFPTVPLAAAGLSVYMQLVDPLKCVKSNLVVHTFL